MTSIIDFDLLSIQEARILAENTAGIQSALALTEETVLNDAVEKISAEMAQKAELFAKMSRDETGCGRWQDKKIKNIFASEALAAKLRSIRCVGIVEKNDDLKTMDVAVPRGPIVAACPVTSPVSTTIYKALLAVKTGNCIVFTLHPRAQKTMACVLDEIIKAADAAGLPAGTISYLHTCSVAGAGELMNHKNINLILITGVPDLYKEAMKTGKPVLYGGEGNGPAFIERTADISQAVEDIVLSKTFDNGAMVAAEQSVVVDAPVSRKVKEEFIRRNAYFMDETESEKVGNLIFRQDGTVNEQVIGKSAEYLADLADIQVPAGTTLLISEQKYVSMKNPYSREKLCPVIAFYIEEDWLHACEKCIELLLNEKQGHTLVIHSTDEAVIEQFALKKPVARVLVNTPASLGGIGLTTNLFPAMMLGSGHVGMGSATDNVSPGNLIYIRKVGYGVRDTSGVKRHCSVGTAAKTDEDDREYLKSKIREILGL